MLHTVKERPHAWKWPWPRVSQPPKVPKGLDLDPGPLLRRQPHSRQRPSGNALPDGLGKQDCSTDSVWSIVDWQDLTSQHTSWKHQLRAAISGCHWHQSPKNETGKGWRWSSTPPRPKPWWSLQLGLQSETCMLKSITDLKRRLNPHSTSMHWNIKL